MGSGYAVAVADVIIAGIQIYAAEQIADEQRETLRRKMLQTDAVAKRIQAREDELRTWWRDTFRECEIRYVQKVCATRPTRPDPGHLRADVLDTYRRSFNYSQAQARECRQGTCAPVSCAANRDMTIDEASATAFGLEAALRGDEDERRLLDGQSRERRQWVANAGRQTYGDPTGALVAAAQIHQQGMIRAAASYEDALRVFGDGVGRLITGIKEIPALTIPQAHTPMPPMPDMEVTQIPAPPPPQQPALMQLYSVPDPTPMVITNLPPRDPPKPSQRNRIVNDLEE